MLKMSQSSGTGEGLSDENLIVLPDGIEQEGLRALYQVLYPKYRRLDPSVTISASEVCGLSFGDWYSVHSLASHWFMLDIQVLATEMLEYLAPQQSAADKIFFGRLCNRSDWDTDGYWSLASPRGTLADSLRRPSEGHRLGNCPQAHEVQLCDEALGL
ncbi:hypothetical protein BDV98DRAFT_345296 [Pterulicium gracile]|uniref:BTB domain-containing protein n=1 Tax=Pterulicium gracile TaxID=1884261 RepID=A0A5C3Q4M1_9AGAR|nr:hypothetical protein BDV98DRAFT_345296 [Pterula gracilis]